MPSKSQKQHNLMEAVAHNPAFAKKVGISQKVGRDFARADQQAFAADPHHANAHPGEGWHGKEHKRHGVKSGKSGKFT